MYLLDTNHCSRLLDGNEAIASKLRKHGNRGIATCVIVRGELAFMAEKSDQREYNRVRVHNFLQTIQIYEIDNETADMYGQIKAAILDRFGPREKAKRRQARTDKLGVSENDLWIAAIAQRFELTVVSADGDFERISAAAPLRLETWWYPEQNLHSA